MTATTAAAPVAERTAAATAPPRRRRPAATHVVLLAFAVLYGLFFAWPLVSIAFRSLNPGGALTYSPSAFTVDNYRELVADPLLRSVIVNTAQVSLTATLVTFLFAFPTAYLMSRLSRAVSTGVFLLVLLPFWVSILVRLFALLELLSTNGPVNDGLDAVGLGRQQLLFNTTGTVIGMVNYLLPYMVLVLYAAMSGVDPNLSRAAKSLGCSSWQAFTRVYLPLIRSSTVGAVLLTFIIATGFFLTPALLGGPGDVTMSTYIAQEVQNYQWGTASAFGVVLLVITMVGFSLAGRLTGLTGREMVMASSKGVSRVEPLPNGPAKWALIAVTTATVVFLFLPILFVFPLSWGTDSTIVWPPRGFTLTWYEQAFSDPLWTSALRKSLTVGIAVALLCLGLSVVLARYVRSLHHRPRLQSVIVSAIYLPVVAPVILLAIGTLDVQNTLHLLGTWWGLVFVESVLALPFTYLVVSAALDNIDPSLEKAAWTMGASHLTAWRRVVLPTLVPALTGAAILAFISSWDEAVVALFQTSFDKTLPVNFYSSVKSGASPVIAAIGATLMLVVLLLGLVLLAVRSIRTRNRSRRTESTPSSRSSS